MRASVSLLLSEGHKDARRYPIATVWYEAQLVRERVNQRIATEATMMHAVAVAVMAPKGRGNKHLQKLFKDLRNGD